MVKVVEVQDKCNHARMNTIMSKLCGMSHFLHFYNNFTKNSRWKSFIDSNLSPPLQLLLYSLATFNYNLSNWVVFKNLYHLWCLCGKVGNLVALMSCS